MRLRTCCIVLHQDMKCIMLHDDATWFAMMYHAASCVIRMLKYLHVSLHHDAPWCIMLATMRPFKHAVVLCSDRARTIAQYIKRWYEHGPNIERRHACGWRPCCSNGGGVHHITCQSDWRVHSRPYLHIFPITDQSHKRRIHVGSCNNKRKQSEVCRRPPPHHTLDRERSHVHPK